jgi:uncharacterized membrane protein YcaP (DUF421 family)
MQDVFFQGWEGVIRTALVGIPAYAAMVAILRVSGKRTLTKLSAFDLVVTVALGSTLATILLNKDVDLAEGTSAIALLVLMQFVMTWTSLRWQALQKILKSSPTLLFYRGEFLEDSMRNERITKEEILAAVRSARLPDLERVEAVVLESDGSLSVISPRLGEESHSLQKIARES